MKAVFILTPLLIISKLVLCWSLYKHHKLQRVILLVLVLIVSNNTYKLCHYKYLCYHHETVKCSRYCVVGAVAYLDNLRSGADLFV